MSQRGSRISDEKQWDRGFVMSHGTGTSLQFDPDAWDDTTILNIFDEAIKSHRSKKV
jgi:hypothetical protein